jgi:hypothetical protein
MSRAKVRRPSRRATRRGVMVSAAGALAVAAALVWQSAYAGFTDPTTPLSASVSTGTVALSNNVEGWYPVTLPEMRPGDSGTHCVIVTSTGSEPAQVKLYSTGRTSTASLADYITFSWVAGTGGGAYGDCTGFVATSATTKTTMSAFPTNYARGAQVWNTVGGAAAESRTYQLTYTMDTKAPTSTKGASASITFVWEGQNR